MFFSPLPCSRYDRDVATMLRVIREFLKIPETTFTNQEILDVCGVLNVNAHEVTILDQYWVVIFYWLKHLLVLKWFRYPKSLIFLLGSSDPDPYPGPVCQHFYSGALMHQQCQQTLWWRQQVSNYLGTLIIQKIICLSPGSWSEPQSTSRRGSTSASTTATPCGAQPTGSCIWVGILIFQIFDTVV